MSKSPYRTQNEHRRFGDEVDLRDDLDYDPDSETVAVRRRSRRPSDHGIGEIDFRNLTLDSSEFFNDD